MIKCKEPAPFSDYYRLYCFGFFRDGKAHVYFENRTIVFRENSVEFEIIDDDSALNILSDDFTIAPFFAFDTPKKTCVGPIILPERNSSELGTLLASNVNAPYLEGSPIVYECRISSKTSSGGEQVTKTYKAPVFTRYIADILGIYVEDILTKDDEFNIFNAFPANVLVIPKNGNNTTTLSGPPV